MTSAAKIFWAVFITVIAAGAVASNFIPALDTGFKHEQYTANAGELTVDTLVGQTFTAQENNLASVRVMFATYSGRNNTEPVRFYLRSSIHSKDDIRTAQVKPSELGDNRLHAFRFEPIPDSAGKQYFFFVVSPASTPGNAVTIDLDTRDPYYSGSAYIVRGQGSSITDPVVLERSGKPTQDVAFALQYQVPLRVVLMHRFNDAREGFFNGWNTSRDVYLAYTWAIAAAGIFLLVIGAMQPSVYVRLLDSMSKRRLTFLLVTLLVAIGLLYRIQYTKTLPLTNDEGNYLYDARSLREGVLAGGDGYVKAPLVIAWVALWQMMLGNTILAGRFASAVAGALTAIPLYSLARNLWTSRAVSKFWMEEQHRWGRRVGLVTAAMWAVFGTAVVSTIYVHTQPLALFFAVSGLAVLLAVLRVKTPKTKWLLVSGILLGLGIASRKSILALGLVPLMLVLFEGKTWRLRWKQLMSIGAGFLVVIALFLGGAYYVYGTEGIWEALGVNSAEDSIGPPDPTQVEQVREYSIRGMTPFFRESLPLILLSVLGLGFSLEYLLRVVLERVPELPRRDVTARLGWLASWIVFIWAWRFFNEYEGAAFMQYGIPWLWWAFGLLLTIATLWPQRAGRQKIPAQEPVVPTSTQPGFHSQQSQDVAHQIDEAAYLPRHLSAAFTVPLWAGGLAFFYMHWIKFHANYISEFIPPLVLLAGFGAVAFFRRLATRPFLHTDHLWVDRLRRIFIFLGVATIAYAIIVSNYITFFFEHTGTFSQGAVEQAATWARSSIPLTDSIFTGAALVPYLSGHHTSLDIAHPRWYAYEFTRTNPKRLNTFLPSAADMIVAYRNANWFLLEQQTSFSFLMEYDEIANGLKRDWQKVHEIDNGGNPLTFYRRIR